MNPNAGGAAYQTLASHASTTTNYFNVLFRPSPNSSIAVYFTTTAGQNALDTLGGQSVPAQAWTHIGATFDAGTIQTYVNCRFSQSFTQGGTLVASGLPLLLGVSSSAIDNVYGGALQDVRIYDRALSAAELCAVMRQPPPLALAPSLAVLPPPRNTSSLLTFFPSSGQ